MTHPGGRCTGQAAGRAIGVIAAAVIGPVGWLALGAGPAAAAAPTVTYSSPGDGAQIRTSTTTVAGTVRMTDGRIKSIVLKITPLNGGSSPSNQSVTGNDGPSQPVSFPATLPLNGRYRAEITVTGNDSLLGVIGPDKTTTTPRDFAVVAPPAVPKGVRTSVDSANRSVTINWSANSEPDLLFYVVQRSLNGGAFVPIRSTSELSFVDTSTAERGGEYAFNVVAVRKGANESEGVSSDASSVATAAVADPPPPPTTTAPPTSAPAVTTGAGTTETTAAGPSGTVVPDTGPATATTLPASSPGALTRSGSVDLSGLRTLQTQAARAPRTPPTTDPGFTETLPFETRVPSAEPSAGSTGVGDEVAVNDSELGANGNNVERTRALAFLAAGLLATVLLMHMLWIKGEVQRVPLEPLPPAPPRMPRRQKVSMEEGEPLFDSLPAPLPEPGDGSGSNGRRSGSRRQPVG